MFIQIFFLVILFIILVLFIRMQIVIQLYNGEEKKEFKIALFLFKKIKVYEYDYYKLRKQEKKAGIERIRLAYDKISDVFGMLKYANKRKIRIFGEIAVRYFKIHITSGAGDVCITAILNGLLWSLAGVLNSVLSGNFRVHERSISVKSSFSEKIINIDTACIIALRIAHIMEVALKILLIKLKRKIEHKKDKAVV